ncbi:hypothetical protein TWF281_002161 [Arthrobotrys megalospora]
MKGWQRRFQGQADLKIRTRNLRDGDVAIIICHSSIINREPRLSNLIQQPSGEGNDRSQDPFGFIDLQDENPEDILLLIRYLYCRKYSMAVSPMRESNSGDQLIIHGKLHRVGVKYGISGLEGASWSHIRDIIDYAIQNLENPTFRLLQSGRYTELIDFINTTFAAASPTDQEKLRRYLIEHILQYNDCFTDAHVFISRAQRISSNL